MAPPQRLPPELNEDATTEILLRIPPDEPEHLFRASVVCKVWLRIVSDAAFLRRYRAFHRGGPLLGFFYNTDSQGSFPGFVPTTAASTPPQLPWHGNWDTRVSDCRHGRVLLEIDSDRFVVWDPLSNHWEELKAPRSMYTEDYITVVLCAVPGCDHNSCRGGPFHVVCVGTRDESEYNTFSAHVYSSKSRSWSIVASSHDSFDYYFDEKRASVIGSEIYYTLDDGEKILKYDMVKHRLFVMDMPPYKFESVPVLMQNLDGSLGIAGVLGSSLYIWSRKVDAQETETTVWVKQSDIKLKEILPVDDVTSINVIGFAEGVEVFFINTNVGAFTYELKSGRVRKVGIPRHYGSVTPFISFFTPDYGLVRAFYKQNQELYFSLCQNQLEPVSTSG